MKRLAGLSTLALIISATSGCGWIWGDEGYFRDRGSDYLSARQVPPMQVPADVELRPIEALLPIPRQVSDVRVAGGDYEVPRPQQLQIASDASDFSVQSSDDGSWLVATRSPSEVWTVIRQYFSDSGFALGDARPATGEFATEWQESSQLDASLVRNLGLKDGQVRVRVRIEPGVQRNTSEIYLLTMQRPAGSSAEQAWPSSSENRALDRVLLDELQASLASGEQTIDSVSLLAERNFDAPSRVSLISDEAGRPVLQLGTDFDRAWSSVGRALQAGDVRVDDLDRSLGVFYINLAEGADSSTDKPGFFARLLGGTADSDAIEARAERYQVRLISAGDNVLVSVDEGVDSAAPEDVARRVLNLLKDGLG